MLAIGHGDRDNQRLVANLVLFCAPDIRVRRHKRIDITNEKMLSQTENLAVPLQKRRLNRVRELTEVEISRFDCNKLI